MQKEGPAPDDMASCVAVHFLFVGNYKGGQA